VHHTFLQESDLHVTSLNRKKVTSTSHH